MIEAIPGHLSAKLLLLEGLGRGESQLSLPGSFTAVGTSAAALLQAAREDSSTGQSTSALEMDAIGDALSELRRIRPRLDRRVLAYATALQDFGTLLREFVLHPPASATEAKKASASLRSTANKVDVELARLRRDREIMEEMR